jgi:putative transcriptional regulator
MFESPPSFENGSRWLRGSAWLALLAAGLIAIAGPSRAAGVADGTLLVASPDLTDPNFSHSVVLVLRSDDNGTIGVIVNRPTTLEPAKVFPELAASIGTYPGKLFRGGPVAPTRLLFLVRGLAAATVQGPEVVDKVFLTGDPASLPDILRLADGTNELRMYAGHAEWVPGQLDREIAAGGWQAVPGTADLVFHTNPAALWAELNLRKDAVVAAAGR